MGVRYEHFLKEQLHEDWIFEWIKQSTNGTIFHQPLFLDYHNTATLKQRGLKEAPVAFFKKNAMIAFLPGGIQTIGDKKVFLSPYGSAYGGPVLRKGLTLENLRRMMEAFQGFLVDQKIEQVRMVMPLPRVPTLFSLYTALFLQGTPLRYLEILPVHPGL